MKVPNAEGAFIDNAKLVDYRLSWAHLRGRHEARVFRDALGLGPEYALIVRAALLDALQTAEATAGDADTFGDRYIVDFPMTGPAVARWLEVLGWCGAARISLGL